MRLADDASKLAIECQGSEQTCARSKDCFWYGRCTGSPMPGKTFGPCRIGSDADCAQTQSCTQKQEGCVRALDTCTEPCENPRLEGIDLPLRRMLEPGQYCMPFAGEKDCSKTIACAKYGLCTNYDGFCVAETDASCRQSEGCAEAGACIAIEGSCYALLDVDVRNSRLCKAGKNDPEKAPCHVLAPGWGRVSIGSAEEARSKCESPLTLIDGYCELPADYDCKSSPECKKEGKCERYIDQNCDQDGHCSDKFAVCVRSDAYCQAQPECAAQGKCKHVARGMVDISTKCFDMLPRVNKRNFRMSGRLVAPACADYVYGECVLSNAGCAATAACAKSGMCSADSPSMYCRPTTTEHCERSQDCKDHGYCRLIPNSTYHCCGATRKKHCETSTDCKESGACTLSAGGVCEPASADE